MLSAGAARAHFSDIRLSIPLITRRLYLGKRAFGINVFPGIDMLPDERIES